MDLLKTILVYMSMVVAASVQNAPDPGAMPAYDEPTRRYAISYAVFCLKKKKEK